MEKIFEKFCLTIIRWGSYLILFLPFFVYRYTLFPYIFPKIIAFQILVEIIFAFWLILSIYEKKYRPAWKNPLILTLTIFIGVLFLTMFTGVDISRSFWGTTERMTGIVTIFHFYLWFLVLTSSFKNWQDWRKFIWVSLFVSLLVGLYGIGQILGFKFLLKGMVGRLSSTLGNPIFLSVYAMVHIFLAGFLFFLEKKWLGKISLVFLLIFNLIIMLLGASRGVALAFILSLLLFLIFLIFILPSRKIKFFISSFLLFLIFAFLILQLPQFQFLLEKSPYFLKRVISTREIDWTRILAWQIAWEGFKEKPIFGWGWENYNIVFNKYYHPRYLEAGFPHTWFDKSHNQVMDILVLSGVLGILSYLALFLFLFKLLYQKIKRESLTKRLSLGILALMFSAYFLQNLFVFDTPAPLIVFYFSLGLAYFVTADNIKRQVDDNYANKNRKKYLRNSVNVWLLGGVLVFVLLPLIIYRINLKPFWQSRLVFKSDSVSKVDFKLGFRLYQKALAGSTFANPEIRLQLAKSIMLTKGKTDPLTYQKSLGFVISEMEKSVKEHPLDVRHHLYLGKFYNLAVSFDKGYLEKAEKSLEKALKLSPKRQEVYYDLGLTKMMLKKNEQALSLLEKALSLNKKIKESYWYLGLALINAERYKEGIEKIEKALEMGESYSGKDPNTLLFIAQAYDKISNYDKAIFLTNFILEKLDKNNVPTMIKKTLFLVKAGRRSEALKLIEKISQFSSNLANELKMTIENF